jgi:hypothetical protein
MSREITIEQTQAQMTPVNEREPLGFSVTMSGERQDFSVSQSIHVLVGSGTTSRSIERVFLGDADEDGDMDVVIIIGDPLQSLSEDAIYTGIIVLYNNEVPNDSFRYIPRHEYVYQNSCGLYDEDPTADAFDTGGCSPRW